MKIGLKTAAPLWNAKGENICGSIKSQAAMRRNCLVSFCVHAAVPVEGRLPESCARGSAGSLPELLTPCLPDSGGTVDGLPSSCAVRWHARKVGRKPRVTTYILGKFDGRPRIYHDMSAADAVAFFPRTQVPTALLLERPLVMSSTLLDAYPCLRKSRVHSLVSGCNLP